MLAIGKSYVDDAINYYSNAGNIILFGLFRSLILLSLAWCFELFFEMLWYAIKSFDCIV